MLSVGLIAIDATILATAVPSIVDDLGGFSQFPWLFSIFLLTQAVSVPIYAKFSDMYGRKPVMLIGIAVFVRRLDALRAGLEHARADRLPGAAGTRRRSRPADVDDDHRRPLHRGRSGPRSRATWPASGPCRRWSARPWAGCSSTSSNWRWIFFINIPLGLLAGLDAATPLPRGRAARPSTPSTTPVPCLLTARQLAGDLRPARGRPAVALAVGAQRGDHRHGGRGPGRASRFVERRAAEPMLPGLDLPPPADQRHQPGQRRGRGDPDRTDLLRAAVRPGRARHQRPGGRLRAGRPHPRLADRRLPRRPALPAARASAAPR